MIPKQTIDEIVDAALIEDVVGEFVQLKKRGANFLGNCPFHNEKTPSFTVSPAKGIYKCFGCGKAGNSVNFIMEHEHYSYPEALRFLANKFNIEIEEEEQSDEQKEAQNERESLYVVSNYAANYFKKQLHESDEGKAIGLSYFIERGFREDIIEKFQLGYNPNEWTAFTDAAEKEGYQLKFLDKTGLTIVKGDKKFDRFKGRVMFPIHNLSGRVLGFGGRILKTEEKSAKYVNSPESEIYSKSKVLYGIYYAKKAITQEDNCFLVEGYTDVISLYQAGVENVVSSSGTSLTEGQIRLIRRFTPNITILYDGDAAGLKASFRGIDMILKEGMNVRVVLFPEGEDPDSYAKNNTTEELKSYITKNAQDFIRFKTAVLIKEVGNDPIKKAELIKDIVGSIAIIPDQIKRSVYTKECSSLLDISEQALINETNKILRGNTAKKTTTSESEEFPDFYDDEYVPFTRIEDKTIPKVGDIAFLESEISRLLINYGTNVFKIKYFNENKEEIEDNITVAEYILIELEKDKIKLGNKTYQNIIDIYLDELAQNKIPEDKKFINHEDEDIRNYATTVLSERDVLSDGWAKNKIFVKTEEELINVAVIRTVYKFLFSKVKEMLLNLQEELKDSKDDFQDNLLQQNRLLDVKKQLGAKLGMVVI